MMVESFNLTLFKSLTSSCALILHQLDEEHERKIARVHLKELLLAEEEGSTTNLACLLRLHITMTVARHTVLF